MPLRPRTYLALICTVLAALVTARPAVAASLLVLASFNGTNGDDPEASLVRDASGNLYGTTHNGGANNDGTVFELAAGSSTPIVLANFNGTNGANPYADLVLDASGNLYGTTTDGGAFGDGTVFEVSTAVSEPATFLMVGQAALLLVGLALGSRGRRPAAGS